MRKSTLQIIAIVAAVLCTCVPVYAGNANVDSNGVAIQGYDPVAYFTEGRPIKGYPEYVARWDEATWMFATAESRDVFEANPKKYAPQYGGFCAYAVSHGSKADIAPFAFSILNEKLYLNYSAEVKALWETDTSRYIKTADQIWERMRK